MLFDVLTLFPGLFTGFLSESLLAAAIEAGRIRVRLHNMRDWANDRHGTMDDTPAGGGPGMVLKVDRVVPCVEEVLAMPDENTGVPTSSTSRGRLILLTPQGRRLDQRLVEELAEEPRLLLLCGRYEGFDDRVRQILRPDEISLGDFVLNGGEVAAMVLIEAVMRLLPGTLGDADSSRYDSFSRGNRLLEGPQYTRPREYRGLEIPDILLGGNHGAIEQWRREQSLRWTRERRPDLLEDDPYGTSGKKRNEGAPDEA